MRLFLTTKHLLRLACEHLEVLQADATYKLLWLNYPVLIIGMSDREKVFHPLGLALCKQETGNDFTFIFKSLLIGITRCGFQVPKKVHLLADGADAITNGFKEGFLEFQRLICSQHTHEHDANLLDEEALSTQDEDFKRGKQPISQLFPK